MEGFNPERSQISQNTLANFIQSSISGDLTEVPGVGPKIARILSKNGVNTTYQLFALFLGLKDKKVETVEHCDRFFYKLQEFGIAKVNITSIVEAVAQKLDISFPGLYDTEYFDAIMKV